MMTTTRTGILRVTLLVTLLGVCLGGLTVAVLTELI